MLNQIICGKSELILNTFPTHSIDLIISSPPYNVNINYDSHNDVMDTNLYFSMLKNVFTECYRILKPSGRIALNLPSVIQQHKNSRTAYLTIDVLLMLREIGFIDRELITWLKQPPSKIKNENAVLPVGHSTAWGSWLKASNPSLRDASEFIIIMHKLNKKKEPVGISNISKNEFLAWTTNVWYIHPTKSKFHPAPFPIELPKRVIKLYSYINDIILDPFCGIGSTCIAAKQESRQFIGIDISENYCKIAKEQLQQEYLNLHPSTLH